MKQKINFSDKYTRTGLAGKLLIDNFYFKIKNLVDQLEIKNVLEVACGSGFSTVYLSQIFLGKEFEASEFEQGLAKEASEKNPGIKIITESIYDLKRQDNSFDLVVALEVLEHLDNPEKALEELRRVTGKYALISVPHEPIWRILNLIRGSYLKDLGNTPGHLNHWSKKSFADFVGRYFRVKEIKSPLPWIIILAEKKND